MGPLRKHLIIYTWGFLKQVKPLGNCISQDSLKNRNWQEICIILYINKLIFINKIVLNSIKILITVVSYSKGLGSGSFLVLPPQSKLSYTEEADSLVVAKTLRLVASVIPIWSSVRFPEKHWSLVSDGSLEMLASAKEPGAATGQLILSAEGGSWAGKRNDPHSATLFWSGLLQEGPAHTQDCSSYII